MNSAVFDIFNIKGDKAIGVVTIAELCSQFPNDSGVGQEVHKMLDLYKEKNLSNQIKRNMLRFDKHNYLKYFPDPCLVKDLDRIFCAQFMKETYVQIPLGFKNENSNEPIARLTCIQDETGVSP